MMLQPIVEPLVVRRKPDKHASRPTVPGDENFFVNSQAQILGKVILDLSQRHRPGLAFPFP